MTPISRHPALAAALLVATAGVMQIFFGEKLAVNDGLGWDGVEYAALVRHLGTGLPSPAAFPDHTTRLLPSAAVALLLKLAHLPSQNRSIVLGFSTLNLLLLTIAGFAWGLIGSATSLKAGPVWLGFVLLFANFATLKMPYYYPVLVDPAAFAVSVLMLLAYVRNSPISLIALTIAGNFVWPTLLYSGLLLLIFPRQSLDKPVENRLLELAAVIGFGLFVLLTLSYPDLDQQVYLARESARTAYPWAAIAGLAVMLLYVYFALSGLWRQVGIEHLAAVFQRNRIPRILAAIAVVVSLHLIRQPTAAAGASALVKLAAYVAVTSSAWQPGLFLVAHAVYFGPVVLLAIIWWKEVGAVARRYGLGLVISLTFMILFSLSSESRSAITFLPFVVLGIAQVAQERKLSGKSIAAISAATLFASKIWLPIGHHLDRYSLNFGPWMGAHWYLAQGGVAATGLLLLLEWDSGGQTFASAVIDPCPRGSETQAGTVSTKRSGSRRRFRILALAAGMILWVGWTSMRPAYPAGKANSTPLPPGEPLAYGRIRLRVKLPGTHAGIAEPLVCFGTVGHAAIIYIRLLPQNFAQIGIEFWGQEVRQGPEFKVPSANAEIDLTCDVAGLYPPLGDAKWGKTPAAVQKLRKQGYAVGVDGTIRLEGTIDYLWPTQPALWFGINPLGGSVVSDRFTGSILRSAQGL